MMTLCIGRSVVISVRSADKGEQAVADIKGAAWQSTTLIDHCDAVT